MNRKPSVGFRMSRPKYVQTIFTEYKFVFVKIALKFSAMLLIFICASTSLQRNKCYFEVLPYQIYMAFQPN